MSKFVNVKKAPKELKKGEYLVEMPSFLQEMRDSKVTRMAKSQGQKVTENMGLRKVLTEIGMKYDPEFNSYTVPMQNYEGLPYETEEDLSNIILRILYKHGPRVIDNYLLTQIKKRPLDTKVIYFVGPFEKTGLFQQEGIDRLSEKEVDAYLDYEKKTKAKPSTK